MRIASAEAPTPERVRVLFFPPGEALPAFNVWADLRGGGGAALTLTLLCDYGADLDPKPGWQVRAAGRDYEVRAAEGRPVTMTLAEV